MCSSDRKYAEDGLTVEELRDYLDDCVKSGLGKNKPTDLHGWPIRLVDVDECENRFTISSKILYRNCRTCQKQCLSDEMDHVEDWGSFCSDACFQECFKDKGNKYITQETTMRLPDVDSPMYVDFTGDTYIEVWQPEVWYLVPCTVYKTEYNKAWGMLYFIRGEGTLYDHKTKSLIDEHLVVNYQGCTMLGLKCIYNYSEWIRKQNARSLQ